MSSRSIAVLTPDDEEFLEQAAAEVYDHLVASSSSDIRHRYAAGQVVNRVRENAAFGEKGIKWLAKSARVKAPTLYTYGKVSAAFTIEDIASAEETAGANDTILQFSVLSELVAVTDDEQRHMLLQKAITSRWTVRQLRREIVESPDSTSRPKKEKSRAQLVAQVNKLTTEFERQLERLDSDNNWGTAHRDEHEGVVTSLRSLQIAFLRYFARLMSVDSQEDCVRLVDADGARDKLSTKTTIRVGNP